MLRDLSVQGEQMIFFDSLYLLNSLLSLFHDKVMLIFRQFTDSAANEAQEIR